MGAAAMKRALHYSVEAMAAETLAIYRPLLVAADAKARPHEKAIA
jgi:hypothetical protein